MLGLLIVAKIAPKFAGVYPLARRYTKPHADTWIKRSGAITGTVVGVNASDSYGTYEVKTTALYSSTFPTQQKDVDVYAVYRNAAGKIIGGTSDLMNLIPGNGKANHVFDDFPAFQGISHVEVYAQPSNF